MIIFPGGVQQKRNFRRGGGVRFGSQFLENPEGRGVIGKIPSVGGGVWIFSGTTHSYFIYLFILLFAVSFILIVSLFIIS